MKGLFKNIAGALMSQLNIEQLRHHLGLKARLETVNQARAEDMRNEV